MTLVSGLGVSGLALISRPESEIPSCSLQVPLDAQTRDPPKLELELHGDMVVIPRVIPTTFLPADKPRIHNSRSQRRKANLAIA